MDAVEAFDRKRLERLGRFVLECEVAVVLGPPDVPAWSPRYAGLTAAAASLIAAFLAAEGSGSTSDTES